MSGARDIALTALATAITVIAIIAAWDYAVVALALPEFLLPRPAAVAAALHQGWIVGALHEHAAFTVAATATGFAAGALAGIVLGALVAEIRPLALAIYPLVIATQSMPTVAIAPLIVVYFGVGMGSKVVTVGLLCFFPIFVNTVTGVRGADPALVDLYRAHGASRWRIFRDVKLPGAVDPIMAGVQVAVVLAFVGCVVSEFVASTRGLGFIIRALASDMNVALMFAAIVSLGAIGAIAGGAARYAHRKLVPWRNTGSTP
jgi:NitT/TauT family transport system permease protein